MLGISLCAVDRSRLIYGNPTAFFYLYVWLQHTDPPQLNAGDGITPLPLHPTYTLNVFLPEKRRDSVGDKVRRDRGNPKDLGKLRFNDPVIGVRSLLTGLEDDMDVTAVLFCWRG